MKKLSLVMILAGMAITSLTFKDNLLKYNSLKKARQSLPPVVFRIDEDIEKIRQRKVGDMNESELTSTISDYMDLLAQRKEICSNPEIEKTLAYIETEPSKGYGVFSVLSYGVGLSLTCLGVVGRYGRKNE